MNLKNQKVKIFIEGGTSVEGIVVGHSKKKICITSENTSNFLVVYEKRILFMIIFNEKNNVQPTIKPTKQRYSPPVNIKKIKELPPPELDHIETDQKKRFKDLSDVRLNQIEDLKKVFHERIKNPPLMPVQENGSYYVIPSFQK